MSAPPLPAASSSVEIALALARLLVRPQRGRAILLRGALASRRAFVRIFAPEAPSLPREPAALCPACRSSELRNVGDVSYLSTHLDRWGNDAATFARVVPPEHWLLSFDIIRCDGCGLAFVPRTVPGLVDHVESHQLFFDRIIKPWFVQTQQPMTVERAARIADGQCRDDVERFHGVMLGLVRGLLRDGAAMLDVGCNAGTFAELVRRSVAGVRVEGCEPNERFRSVAIERYPDLPVSPTPLAPADGGPTYDVVFCADVIEHIWSLDPFAQALCERVSPGGALVVATPDVDCPAARQQGLRWWGFIAPHHAQLFGLRALDELFARHAFSRIDQRSFGDEVVAVYRRRDQVTPPAPADDVRNRSDGAAP